MSLNKITNYFYFQIIILFIIYSYNEIHCNEKCKDSAIMVLDDVYCPTTISCPDYLLRINLYSCAYSQDFAPLSKCKTGKECWNGECVTNEDELYTSCPTHISCPNELRYKCPDNTCVSEASECPDYVECPSFVPIRCPNGDCRKNLNDCPSLIRCPDNNPVLCNDGTCRNHKDSCMLPSEETACSDKTMTRCSDGTCTNSKFLCPTLVTCPVGYEKCYYGVCKPKGTCHDGTSAICNQNEQVICQFDSSCASEINNCPTGIICPLDKPVKCWDNSCRDSIENCPEFQSCPAGLNECPDGSCALGLCGTHITCSVDAPYRCFDNTCRRNPEDSCPSETPILCWDGRCLAERGECLTPSLCDRFNPVKCPNGLCTKSAFNCKEENECPSEFVKCKDGTCRKKLAYCPSEACPVNLPYKCKNGLCVSDEKYCDKDNGCPFNLPIKCSDGSCVSEEGECPKEVSCKLKNRPKLCPDGSCVGKDDICPSVMGCPTDTPFRCANGECINLKKTSCSIPICDPTIPIKCFDGTCALTSNYCPIERKTAASGNVICADGTEAHSYDECKPLVPCPEGEGRCQDGSCRGNTTEECPLGSTCPKGETRCPNGSCAKKESLCPVENGCPLESKYKCPRSGYCVSDLDICEKYESEFDEANGCPSERPYKCPKTKNCVVESADCETLETDCSNGQIMCLDGYCSFDDNECNDEHYGDCEVDGRTTFCAEETGGDPCARSMGDCYSKMNCKLNAPFRCGNGDCKRYPSKGTSSNTCELAIVCPEYKPYLCADGSCVEKSTFCKSYSGCSEETPYLCDDKTCSSSKDDCEKNHKKCPAKNPLLCPNGNCASGIYDCDEGKCPEWTPYFCISGDCKNNPRDCHKIKIIDYLKNIGSVCRDDEYICIDGSCRENAEDCPLYKGCVSNSAPFKCLDGGCAKNKDSCSSQNNEQYFQCPDNTILCEDGVCRNNCSLVEFNGCPNARPLLCSNGRCVSQEIECVGESACDSTEKPFRCIDGTCGASLADCKVPFREVGDTNVLISLFPKMEMIADLIIGPNNILSGKVEIPSGTITSKSDKSSIDTQITFRSISRNKIEDTYTIYEKTRVDDLKAVYPYADPDDNFTLNYQYTVLSSVIEVKLKEPETTEISGKILLTLLFDFPYKHEKLEKTISYDDEDEDYSKTSRYTTLPLNYNKDVCLAKLNAKTRKWECNKLNFNVEAKNNLQLTGEVNEEGIYAVVLELRMNDNKLYINENWFISNLKLITIILLVLIFLIGLAIYIFTRIYRYRIKYKGTKEIYKGFELELSDLQDKSVTGRQGQTLGDVKEGIIYTDNIAFKSQIDTEARKKNTQLEKIFDAYTKKLRLLERNNALLKGQYDSIKNEYNRLNTYKDTLKEGDQVKIEVNIKEPTENQDIGAINDDDDD